MISRNDAVHVFGSIGELAAVLGLTYQAVAQWPDDEDIPLVHQLRLALLIAPDRFKEAARVLRRRHPRWRGEEDPRRRFG